MTKDEIKIQLKSENPTIRVGSDQDGYTELSAEEYDAILEEWASNKYAKQEKQKAEEIAVQEAEAKRSAALVKLAVLGLDEDDLKALGL